MLVDQPLLPRSVERAIEEVPAISPIVGKIREMATSIETSPKDLVKVIMLDPVLTGKVIRLVNSSFYGLPNKVQSLAQAVVLLGLNTVKNLAISTAIMGTMFLRDKDSPIQAEDFWKHCLATAVASKMIARFTNVPKQQQEQYFIAGLLHDLGKIVLMKAEPGPYRKVMEEAEQFEVLLTFSEQAHFGCDHVYAGAVLAEKWKLDPDIARVIAKHHQPHSEPDPLVDAVIMANNIAKEAEVGDGGDRVIEEISFDLIHRIGLDHDELNKIVERLPQELEKAAIFLNIMGES